MQIAAAVDVVVHVERLASGARKVERISEVQYVDGELVAHDIFALEILNQRIEARLNFVNRPMGERFHTREITSLFEDKP